MFKSLPFWKIYLFPFILAGDDDKPADDPQPTEDPSPLPKPDEVLDVHKNFVKKEEYESLQKDYKDLVKKILDGGDVDIPNEEEDTPDISELRKELYNPDNTLSNLEYVEKTLKLRKAYMEEHGKDPFLPAGINGDPFKTDAERAAAEASAQKVAKVLEEAVKEAEGDPEVFDVILSKLIK